MPLNIKDLETERLAAEVANLAGETKTRAVRTALQERRERLRLPVARRPRGERLLHFLTEEAWPQIPREILGKPLSRQEREEILGHGPDGL